MEQTVVDEALVMRVIESHNRLISGLRDATKTALELAIEVGRELNDQRQATRHGDWGEFCRQFLTFNRRTADRYVQVWVHKDEVEAAIANDLIEPSLRQALKYLGDRDREREEKSSATVKKGLEDLSQIEVVSEAFKPVMEALDEARGVLEEYLDMEGRAPQFLARAVERTREFYAGWATAAIETTDHERAIDGYTGDHSFQVKMG